MCHTMIVGAATVVIALLVIAGIACVVDSPPEDVHAASASVDMLHLTRREGTCP